MSLYSYSYRSASSSTPLPQTPLQHFLLEVKSFVAQKRVRFILFLMVQSLIVTVSTGVYIGMHNGTLAQGPASAIANMQDADSDSTVLGTADQAPQEPTATPTLTITPTPNLAQLLDKPSKRFYKIAVYGDSMVDTMGEVLEYLDSSLHKHYPDTKFLLYNYGIGSQNVADGLDRYHKQFNYKTRRYLPIDENEPDVIIIGSFAYNPFSPHDRDRHWLTLTALVQEAQKSGAQVYMLAEIAPLRRSFGKGPQGVNWDTQTAYEHSGRIVDQLENAVGLAKSLNVPIFDAYTSSLEPESKIKEGKVELVNPDDGIHPSVKGHQFMSDLIADQIVLP